MEAHRGESSSFLASKWSAVRSIAWPFFVDATAGTVGGACCVLMGHPLDTAKVLMQAQSSTSRYPTTIGCLIELQKTRGVVRGWYAGGGAALVANSAENACLFASYLPLSNAVDDALQSAPFSKFSVLQSQNNVALVKGAVAGSLAAVLASAVLCPIELVKVRVQTGEAASTLQCTTNILRQSGIRGLFVGLGATVLREVPGNIAFFGAYEYCLATFERRNIFQSNDSRVLVAGGLGGIGFWLVALPADAIKTQQQVFRDTPTFATAALDIYRNQGLRAFYRGLIPVVARAFPSNAALFWGVAKTKEFFAAFD
mmetsp:Transcript_22549/g.39971  ORF Transcript_22549/g.39971 Transcript_22549/m.39971 type:complete len:313 (-) Transcript_22549:135-1073(-)|eukprot:CAMPEP_0184552600 /NCGR_PEP_ID=MMETSP0199_2-20130426/29475_1 /TAXON_ID=1112570 /ORGANISM="Thraustochytrium sp., Strain LLF1b" /LENGTH=312 /DNA_ID=CAMNT_0026948133 /DNA_START=264 /DNA_END=1202 /DNA_ORIENTATION=+